VAINGVLLQQVLINLIVNACDAMVRNSVTERHIEIVSRCHESDVEIVISDSGKGIENTEQIFDAFFTTKEHGIGLGLAICRMILTAQGGSLWATNNPARGASLHVSIPAAGGVSNILVDLGRISTGEARNDSAEAPQMRDSHAIEHASSSGSIHGHHPDGYRGQRPR
jgi:hypothetical protein